MIEDKEYPVQVTDDMIMEYEKMVYRVYYTYYHRYFSYMKDDLIQCGFWGVFLAYQRWEKYKSEFKNHYFWKTIHNKMWQYIDHEKHHITKEQGILDFEYKCEKTVDITTNIDVDRALNTLSEQHKQQIIDWANDVPLGEMGFRSRQNSYQQLQKSFKKLKEKL